MSRLEHIRRRPDGSFDMDITGVIRFMWVIPLEEFNPEMRPRIRAWRERVKVAWDALSVVARPPHFGDFLWEAGHGPELMRRWRAEAPHSGEHWAPDYLVDVILGDAS